MSESKESRSEKPRGAQSSPARKSTVNPAPVKPSKTKKTTAKSTGTGRLKIGDNWNAITIIALSQTNPLKAIAEFVENSIDARARNIKIIRGKHRRESYIKIIDDGEGIDDFSYLATHIGDSIKRKLKKEGIEGIQGEFGIGLLSFWTVGEQLAITSTGAEGKARRMKLVKNNPGYSVTDVPALFPNRGTELHITPLLPGIRQLSGEKIQNYLASELRDRISKSGVEIRIVDNTARKELIVEPRKFSGRLIHNLPQLHNPHGEIYCELYVADPAADNAIGLYRQGTRVIQDITTLDAFSGYPWNTDFLEGIIDVSFLQLTPGTRDGVIFDHKFDSFLTSIIPVAPVLEALVREQKQAEEEKASKSILKKITRALREALLFLPTEEYSWLQVKENMKPKVIRINGDASADGDTGSAAGEGPLPDGASDGPGLYDDDTTSGVILAETPGTGDTPGSRNFFDFPGPLHSAVISPSSVVISVEGEKIFQVKARDRSGRTIDDSFSVRWEISEGAGKLSTTVGEIIRNTAPKEPGIEELRATVTQRDIEVTCTAVITVTQELFPTRPERGESDRNKKGLPGYTFKHSPGELWRSRYDQPRSIIVINSGHADYLYASRANSRKLRYITKLYAKELVLVNFPEADKEKLLERMIELQLYTEENL